ncbi:queuine tRNA-ribosyltransferase subunit QTRTD1 homolog [Fopius arisanus]|uniref:Queuine tRNA-ribosyltransferase accessory subunit 2 n=1 Tax=Fopius arisanus TaxID=64838 RepID=A0A9R1TTG5_9HYME|nr:PREDICTED: queuine tRNA-ribosyltransferase subunit QTRTD1 homolog [Fopius arisanus]
MKFITDSVSRCARLGSLSELEKFPEAIFETPLLVLYTRRGSVPHLTKDVFKMLTDEQHMLSVSLPTTLTMVEAVKQSDSFSEFVGMKEYPTILTIQDSSEVSPHGHQKHITTAIWTKHGHHPVSPDIYMDIVEAFKPDIYVGLCDGDSNEKTNEKKIMKVVDRSKRQFEKCLERHKSSEILKKTCLLGAVEGGYDLRAREVSANFLREKNLEGYVIDGLHVNGPEVQNISFETIKEVVQHTLALLPPEKLKVSMGSWSPHVILELIDSGVDVFDSSYPYVMTENFKALTFMCDSHNHGDDYKTELAISVADKCYVDDFSPICNECQCLTCRNHSRAYLNHLHNTKELLCSVLLMIHNTHVYLEFFKAIRENIKNGKFKEFKHRFLNQFS